MAVTAKAFASFPLNLFGSNASGGEAMALNPDTIKGMLSTITYVPNQTTHTVKGDVTNETSGTGYTAGGNALTTKSTALSSGLVATWDADDLSWTTASFSAAVCVLYDDTRATPVKPLISYVDFGGTQTVTAATLSVVWSASGIFTITVA